MLECVKFVNTLPHIYTMKTMGDLLQGFFWVEALVEADISKQEQMINSYEQHILHAHE